MVAEQKIMEIGVNIFTSTAFLYSESANWIFAQ